MKRVDIHMLFKFYRIFQSHVWTSIHHATLVSLCQLLYQSWLFLCISTGWDWSFLFTTNQEKKEIEMIISDTEESNDDDDDDER